jgi:hypothetical protein
MKDALLRLAYFALLVSSALPLSRQSALHAF